MNKYIGLDEKLNFLISLEIALRIIIRFLLLKQCFVFKSILGIVWK